MTYQRATVSRRRTSPRRAAANRSPGRPRRRRAVRPAIVLAHVLELCLLVGIVVVLAASIVRIH